MGGDIYCIDKMFSGMGNTSQAAKQNIMDSLTHFVHGAKTAGYKSPK